MGGDPVSRPKRKKLEKYIRQVQQEQWNRLEQDIRQAINGHWSIATEHQVLWLEESIELVGPISWKRVSWNVVKSGLYLAVVEATHPDAGPTGPEFAKTDEYMAVHTDPATLAACVLAASRVREARQR